MQQEVSSSVALLASAHVHVREFALTLNGWIA